MKTSHCRVAIVGAGPSGLALAAELARSGIDNVVVHHDEPYLTVRLKVMPLPSERREEFFETLLRLNRTDMVHGAYGIEDDAVVITDTIQSPNLDLNELQATLEAVILAVSEHYEMLSAYK